MTHQTPFIYSLISCLLIISISCKKTNETYPEVKILSPAEGTTYSFGDTIFVTVEIKESDATPIVNVLDGSINTGLPFDRVSASGSQQDFQFYFNKSELSSGKYTIRVTASNGTNTRSDFSDIYLKQEPLEYLGFISIAASSLIKVDNQGVTEEKYLNGNYYLLAYNERQGRVVTAPESNGNLRGYSYSPLQQEYNIVSTTGVKKYNALVNDKERVYSLAANGEIKAYSKEGSIERSFLTRTDLEPISGCSSNEGLLICAKERGKENYSLQLLNATNGAELKTMQLPGRAIGIVNPSNGIYTVAMKGAGETMVSNYEPSTNTLTRLFSLQGEPTCLFTDYNGVVLVSTTNAIFAFQLTNATQPYQIYNFSANDIGFDKVSQQILIASGNQIYRGNVNGASATVYHQEIKDILQVEAVHNR
ncbi:Ig-like domain-containing protein [Owenweeksia hongkongensis]|uniref:Ig-like domain-containing protein n=1 Tax=Owenweeksia hongkongensis TaxID=253245 RepID=UPI003A9569ED